MVHSRGFARRIRRDVDIELLAAKTATLRGDQAKSFHHLERAPVLGQASTAEHVRVHFQMLIWAIRQRRVGEVLGQILRIVGAATKTAFGLVPHGNTGGSDVPPYKSMPVPPDLAALIMAAREGSRRAGE